MTQPQPAKSSSAPPCSCRVTGPDYEQTRFDKACPYHGTNGTMIAVVPVRRSK